MNTCPSCNEPDYLKSIRVYSPPDCCCGCGDFICTKCSVCVPDNDYDDDDDDEDEYHNSYMSRNCYIINLDNLLTFPQITKNINSKISRHQTFDKAKFKRKGTITVDYVKKLLREQLAQCYYCKDLVLINYETSCLYQYSIDRLDNNKPHDIENVVISCYYCNCKDHPDFGYKNKQCLCNEHKQNK